MGEAGIGELLVTTIAAGPQNKSAGFERIIVDITVQENAIVYPTDSRLREVARAQVVQWPNAPSIQLTQTEEMEVVLRFGGDG